MSHRPRHVDRRDALQAMGSAVGLTFLSACAKGSSPTSADAAAAGTTSDSSPVASSNASCVVTPQLTEGPYFVDEGLDRSDIRTDPSTGVARPGVPLDITVAVSQVASGSCGALAGALVDVWHCDALGVYSDVSAQRTVGERFLRGYQVTDAGGLAHFLTIYPGWYPGRAVHVHFKVRTSPQASRGLEFTSQIFFDEALTDVVHAQAPYRQKGRRDTLNSADGIYRGGGPVLIAPLAASGGGYTGTFHVGIQT